MVGTGTIKMLNRMETDVERNWPDNQDYIENCWTCKKPFLGPKREHICYICVQPKLSAVDIYLGKTITK